jgi:hypothetical protein
MYLAVGELNVAAARCTAAATPLPAAPCAYKKEGEHCKERDHRSSSANMQADISSIVLSVSYLLYYVLAVSNVPFHLVVHQLVPFSSLCVLLSGLL